MKILYELKITEETGFTDKDFPDRFEILRESKTPLVFKPVAINTQEIYSRMNEAERLLIKVVRLIAPVKLGLLTESINDYFKRHKQ